MRIVIHAVIAVILVSLGPWLTPLPCFGESLKSEKRAIVVGGALNYPPYEFLDKDGKPTGYAVELTRAIAT
jgi:polar amino acid transport system substrate-binding protein